MDGVVAMRSDGDVHVVRKMVAWRGFFVGSCQAVKKNGMGDVLGEIEKGLPVHRFTKNLSQKD